MSERLSSHFSYAELVRSPLAVRHGIDNRVPDADVLAQARALAVHVLEPIRRRFGAFSPSSWYRCEKLEWLLCEKQWLRLTPPLAWAEYFAGKQHPKGCAVDLVLPRVPAEFLFGWMQEALNFDQLLLEGRDEQAWVHVSYVGNHNRREVHEIPDP